MELYIHIPFCRRKCLYCDFLSFPAYDGQINRYIDTLIRELRDYSGLLCDVSTVFIGGGTPSILDIRQTDLLLKAVAAYSSKAVEWSIECNPGTLDREKLGLYREYGINRLSLGLQSADADELIRLGRIHDPGQFYKTYDMARETGFDNINIDIMSGLPGQTINSWEKTLRTCAELKPEHISAYSLIIEPGTPFYDIYGHDDQCRDHCDNNVCPLPSEEDEREMYHMTGRILGEFGFERYEISNYSLPGYECRHNLGYWKGAEYLGIGIGAASYYNGMRYKNTSDIGTYLAFSGTGHGLEESRSDVEVIGPQEKLEEFMILRLRLKEGISRKEFKDTFGFGIEEKFGEIIDKYVENGLLISRGDRLFLSERGTDLANTVMSDFCE